MEIMQQFVKVKEDNCVYKIVITSGKNLDIEPMNLKKILKRCYENIKWYFKRNVVNNKDEFYSRLYATYDEICQTHNKERIDLGLEPIEFENFVYKKDVPKYIY